MSVKGNYVYYRDVDVNHFSADMTEHEIEKSRQLNQKILDFENSSFIKGQVSAFSKPLSYGYKEKEGYYYILERKNGWFYVYESYSDNVDLALYLLYSFSTFPSNSEEGTKKQVVLDSLSQFVFYFNDRYHLFSQYYGGNLPEIISIQLKEEWDQKLEYFLFYLFSSGKISENEIATFLENMDYEKDVFLKEDYSQALLKRKGV